MAAHHGVKHLHLGMDKVRGREVVRAKQTKLPSLLSLNECYIIGEIFMFPFSFCEILVYKSHCVVKKMMQEL